MHPATRLKKLLGIALAALLSSGFSATLVGCGQGEAPGADALGAAETEALPVAMAVAAAREQPITLTLDGTLVADEESQVTSVVAGRVVEVLVERGAVVEEGQPLVRLRDVDYRLQAASARAQLDQARARLGVDDDGSVPPPAELPEVQAAESAAALAESNLQRAEELAQRGVLSEQSLDEARQRAAQARQQHQTTLNNARSSIASLASARSALSQARTSATETTVRAPFAGEIADRAVSVGEYVSPQTPIVTLVRTDPLRIEVQVPQQHLTAVRPGQTVQVTVDAVSDRVFEGTVRYVSASVQRATRGLTVEAVVPNDDRTLRPGLFATARIETGATHEVAVVPAAAVMNQAGVDRVFVVVDGVIQERVVSVSERRGDEVVVAEGVVAGEQVATERLVDLVDGMRVAPAAPARAAAAPAPAASAQR